MGWPKELVLVRHAESEGNVRDVAERAEYDVATHDYDITERGREQARITGEWLHGKYPDGFDVFYTSYYRRARETMAVMYPDAKVYEDPRLAEGQRGIYHTYTEAQIAECFPYERARKEREGLYHYRPPGGENWADIELRIHSFLGTVTRDLHAQRVLIVVHGHWLLLMQRLIEHFSIEDAIDRYKGKIVANTSVTRYVGNGGYRRIEFLDYVVPWEGKL